MKIVYVIILLCLNVLYAENSIKVLQGPVDVSIGGKVVPMKMGYELPVECGKEIFVKSKKGEIALLKDNKEEKTLVYGDQNDSFKCKKNIVSLIIEKIGKAISSAHYTNESMSSGTPSKGTEPSGAVELNISINKKDIGKNILIYAENGIWGKPPYVLKIFRDNNIYREFNNTIVTVGREEYAGFVVPISILKSGDRYEIENAIGAETHLKTKSVYGRFIF